MEDNEKNLISCHVRGYDLLQFLILYMSLTLLLGNPPEIKLLSWIKRGLISPVAEKEQIDVFLSSAIPQAKPFIKWVGGKRQLLKQFRELYPIPNKFNPETNTYFEPFVGGGAVFFDIQPYTAVLSDVNRELVTTYQVIKNSPEDLIKSLKKHKYEKEYYLKVRAKNPEKLSRIEVASRFIFLNRTGFNGMYRVNKSGGFNIPFGRYNNPTICDDVNIRNVHNLLENVEVKNRDYKEVLREAKKGDFIYFDPPYHPVSKTSSFTSYTASGFSEKEQKDLCNLFGALDKKGCYVMLSNSDTPFIREIYKDFKIKTVLAGRSVNSSAGKRGKVKEVIVCNY